MVAIPMFRTFSDQVGIIVSAGVCLNGFLFKVLNPKYAEASEEPGS